MIDINIRQTHIKALLNSLIDEETGKKGITSSKEIPKEHCGILK